MAEHYQKNRLQVIGWAVAAEILFLAFFVPNRYIDNVIEREQQIAASHLGIQSADWVYSVSRDTYRYLMIEPKWFARSGVYYTLHRFLIPTEREQDASRGIEEMGNWLFNYAESCLDGMMRTIYLFISRLIGAAVWLPMIPLALIPAINDGLQMREIKKRNAGYASPVLQKYSIRASKALCSALLFIYLLPLALSPLLFPLCVLISSAFINIMLANVQKRI